MLEAAYPNCMKPLRPSLAAKLKKCREDALLTQPELAQKIGVKEFQNISKWERGVAKPSPKFMEKLAELYGRPVGYFLDQGVDLHSAEDRPASTRARKTILLEAAEVLAAYGKATPELQREIRRKLQLERDFSKIDSEVSQVVEARSKRRPKGHAGDQG